MSNNMNKIAAFMGPACALLLGSYEFLYVYSLLYAPSIMTYLPALPQLITSPLTLELMIGGIALASMTLLAWGMFKCVQPIWVNTSIPVEKAYHVVMLSEKDNAGEQFSIGEKIRLWLTNAMVVGSWLGDVPETMFFGAYKILGILGIIPGIALAISIAIVAAVLAALITACIGCFGGPSFSKTWVACFIVLGLLVVAPIIIGLLAMLLPFALLGCLPCFREGGSLCFVSSEVLQNLQRKNYEKTGINMDENNTAKRFIRVAGSPAWVGMTNAAIFFGLLLISPIILLVNIVRVIGYCIGLAVGIVTLPLMLVKDPHFNFIQKDLANPTPIAWFFQYLWPYSQKDLSPSGLSKLNETAAIEATVRYKAFHGLSLRSYFHKVEDKLSLSRKNMTHIMLYDEFKKAALVEKKAQPKSYPKGNAPFDLAKTITEYLEEKDFEENTSHVALN